MLAKGEEIEVTGSKFAEDLPVLLIAKELKKGKSFLELRDSNGKPLWINDGSPVSSSRFAFSSIFAANMSPYGASPFQPWTTENAGMR